CCTSRNWTPWHKDYVGCWPLLVSYILYQSATLPYIICTRIPLLHFTYLTVYVSGEPHLLRVWSLLAPNARRTSCRCPPGHPPRPKRETDSSPAPHPSRPKRETDFSPTPPG